METDPLRKRIPEGPGGYAETNRAIWWVGDISNDFKNRENINRDYFGQLRIDTHQQMAETLTQRIQNNPSPSTRELFIGTYEESLEPQVRDAVFRLGEKGYQTRSSGFFGSDDDWRVIGIDVPRTYNPLNRQAQVIDFVPGTFTLDNETIGHLDKLGAEVAYYAGYPVRIGFVPESPDLNSITNQWESIAAVMPDLGSPALPVDPTEAQAAFVDNAQNLGLSSDTIASSPLSGGNTTSGEGFSGGEGSGGGDSSSGSE